jgi:hypothetical protein
MKIRSGFVSNSSSASFLCEVCGDCWESDHSPSIVGGLCEVCHETHEICNCCGTVFKKSELFITKNVELSRGGDPVGDHDEQDRADWTSWDTKMTCAWCLTTHAEMVEAWVNNNQHQEWVKKVSNPAYNMQKVDAILTEAIMKHNR